jgi:hypothetical protein
MCDAEASKKQAWVPVSKLMIASGGNDGTVRVDLERYEAVSQPLPTAARTRRICVVFGNERAALVSCLAEMTLL